MKFYTGAALLGESLWTGLEEKELGKLSLVWEGFPASIWWKQIYAHWLLPPALNLNFFWSLVRAGARR